MKTKFEIGELVIFNNKYHSSIWTDEPGIIEDVSYSVYSVYFFNIPDSEYQRPTLEGHFLDRLYQIPFNFNEK